MKRLSTISSWLVIILNLPLLVLLITMYSSDGGYFGLMSLIRESLTPFLIGCNIFIVPAILNLFIKSVKLKWGLIFVGIIGIIFSVTFLAKLIAFQIIN